MDNKNQKSDRFKVLIENYDLNADDYKLGKQEIVDINTDDVKKLLQSSKFREKYEDKDPELRFFSPENTLSYYRYRPDFDNPILSLYIRLFMHERIEDYGFHSHIETEKLIISKIDKETCEFIDKSRKMFLFIQYYPRSKFSLNFKPNIQEWGKISFTKIFFKFFTPFLFFGLLLTYLIWTFNYFNNQFNYNIYFLIFWVWLVILLIINLYYAVRFRFKKEKLNYRTPILSDFKPFNLSRFLNLIIIIFAVIYLTFVFIFTEFFPIILIAIRNTTYSISEFLGQFFVQVFLDLVSMIGLEWVLLVVVVVVIILIYIINRIINSEDVRDAFWSVVGFILKWLYFLISFPFYIAFIQFKFNKEKKKYILHNLIKIYQEEKNPNKKNYYLNLIFGIEELPSVTIDIFTKLIAFLTFLVSIIPPLINLYIA